MPIWCGMHEYLQASYWELLSVLWAKQPPNTCPYEEVRLIFYKHNLSTVAPLPAEKKLTVHTLYILLINQEWGHYREISDEALLQQGRGLRFLCNDWTDKVNKLLIIWPFHYGPEPAVNKNQQLASG